MNTFYIYRGIPASGKSTVAMSNATSTGAIRVSRDDIRYTNLGAYWGVDENIVTKLQYAAFNAAFKTGRDVISDATNLVAKDVRSQMELATSHGYEVQVHDFPIDLNEAIARDAGREKSVGEDVIRSFHRRFIRKDGSFPPIPVITTPAVEFTPYIAPGAGFPHAILVDIDGTLAHHEGIRGPYDTSRYHLDNFDLTIGQLAEAFVATHGQTCYTIIMSGRDEDYRQVTQDWLNDWAFPHEALLMRPSGDRREDSIVKNELFEQHVAGQFNVDLVLDDRNRVVNMWRAKGLKCLQVQPGDF